VAGWDGAARREQAQSSIRPAVSICVNTQYISYADEAAFADIVRPDLYQPFSTVVLLSVAQCRCSCVADGYHSYAPRSSEPR